MVSDAQLSDVDRRFTLEYAYEYEFPIQGDTEDIQLPFAAEIENKFYYSLPWRTISVIDETVPGGAGETPTPSPSPTTTITPTFFEEEPLGEYIYDSMEAVSIIGGDNEGQSVVGFNDRQLTTFQGVNGVTGLTLENNIVTLTETGRYYIKARTSANNSESTYTAIKFLSGDKASHFETIKHALGITTSVMEQCIPKKERSKCRNSARMHVGIWIIVILTSIIYQTWLPVLYLDSGGIPEYTKNFGICYTKETLLESINLISDNYMEYQKKLKDYPYESNRMLLEYEKLFFSII